MAWSTVKQVAERLGLAASTVYQLCSEHRLAHARIGIGRGAIRISEESLQAFLDGATVPSDVSSEPPPATPPERLKHIRI
jgi:excisionase family DNA binding protein